MKIGKFCVSADLRNLAAEVLKDCKVLNINENGKLLEYTAIHGQFRDIPKGHEIPLYEAIVHAPRDGDIRTKFREIGWR